MTQDTHDRLLIIDFGSQVTQLIARRLRELNVYCEIHPFNLMTDEKIAAYAPKAIILSGGPASVTENASPRTPDAVFQLGLWEKGAREQVWMSHGDRVEALPEGFRVVRVTDPEQKRKIIGGTFIDVFDEEAHKIGGADFLAQGTLYPDVIESVSFTGGPSLTIKSHHNVGGLPARMRMKLVEPLRELFKDEVRDLGRELGLPDSLVKRHPFPGPGLAIRIPGEITDEKLEILRKADVIYLDEIRNAGLYDAIWQAFAVLLPVRTVGVMGDGRTYDYVCALRAVTSTDGMTADSYPFDHAFLARVATRIINEVRGINRVVYDVTSKPPGTIEWE